MINSAVMFTYLQQLLYYQNHYKYLKTYFDKLLTRLLIIFIFIVSSIYTILNFAKFDHAFYFQPVLVTTYFFLLKETLNPTLNA